MQKTVVVRSRGMITIPLPYRQALDIGEDTPLISCVMGDSIILAKNEDELRRVKEAFGIEGSRALK